MKYINKFGLTLLAVGCSFGVNAQDVVQHEKSAYVDSLNRYYIQTEQPLYLYLSTKPNDANPTPIPNSNSATTKNEVEPMYLDGNGVHTIQHYDAICGHKVIFYVRADGIAPVTQSIFNGTVATVNKQAYYGLDIDISLKAKDDMSGVMQSYYSINGAPYQKYSADTKIDVQQGANTLKYYSVDHVGNMEKVNEKTFTVDNVAPVTYHTITGIGLASNSNVISTTTVIYLEGTDTVTGVAKTFYRIDGDAENLYNGKSVPVKQLSDGEHTLYYYSEDKVGNKEKERSLTFFLDKSGPIVATDVLGDKFIVNDQVYFSGRSKMKLTAVDNKVGVRETKYSINGSEYVNYTEPFYLPSKSGIHVIRYFAIDSLGNATAGVHEAERLEYRHIVNTIYVDLSGPTLAYKYKGPTFTTRDTVFISSNTEIVLSATDSESGLKLVAYALDKNPTEIPYKEGLTIPKGGTHHLDIIGYDNVNNRNVIYTSFVVDNVPPVIQTVFSVDPIGNINSVPVYPSYVQLFVAPSDHLTGIDKIRYSVNEQPMKDYQRYIDGFQTEQQYDVKIVVTDKLNNSAEKTVTFIVKNK
ncbi:MAG: hypothetical protein LBU62_02670 [Bacteroidales bacterium]|jgi:hypothetical protein|nr:hypothetical protein [Bacteroidales bacterium]